ncbi:MAG: hypothetical protein J6I96_07610 [Oscillospiraceae bacterium]|nr:hypothetical protein [Oscillospiraceae bacterium]
MRISFKQRIICGLTAFAFTITALTPSAWVFAEELSAEGTTSETAVAETALAETTPSETAPAETADVTASEASDTAETAADTSVTAAEEPAVMPVQTGEVSDDAGVLSGTIGYETYLDIKAADGGITDGLITGTAVTAGEGKEIMAAASFTQSELGAKTVIVAVKELPEINNGEMTALYGIKGGVLSEDAIAVSPEVGLETEVSLSDWEGVALVKILPSEQEISFRGEDDEAVLSVSGMLPDGAEISAQPVETAEVKEKIENDTQTETVPITDVVFAYDISINSAAGEFQPGEGESVDVVLSSPAIAEAAERGGKLTVVHIADDGTVTEVLCEVSDGSVSFAAEGFSVYAVVEHTIEGTVSIADTTYKITVEYGDEAGIPAGAYLRAWWADPEEYLPGTAETLGWTEDDEVYYAKFFDLSIMFDGKVIEPQAPVFVTAELLDVEEGAKALRVVHFTGDGAEEVKSNITDDAVISFETSGFSVYGFGSVMHTIASETTDSLEFSVYSFDEAKTDSSFTDIAVPEEGFEAVKTVSFTERPEKLWVKASLAEGAELPKGESIGIYSVYDNAAKDVIIEDITAGGGLCPVAGDASGVALVKDTGYRHLNLKAFPDEASAVALDGMMPKGSAFTASDVTADAAADDDEDTTTLAAYDITINAPDGEYQPDEQRPISVEITDPRISGENIAVYHITDDGVSEEITGFTLSEGRISFTAVGFSVYKIVDGPPAVESSDLFKLIDEEGGNGLKASFVVGTPGNASTAPDRGGPYYFEGSIAEVTGQGGRTGIQSSAVGDDSNAEKLYFETFDVESGKFYIYFLDELGNRKYIKMVSGSFGNTSRTALKFADGEDDKTVFTLKKNGKAQNLISVYDEITGGYWNRTSKTKNDNKKSPVTGYINNNDAGMTWISLEFSVDDDPYSLNGNTYGLMNFTGGTHGYSLVSDTQVGVHSLVELVTHKTAETETVTLYVDEGSETTRWTFHNVREDLYTLSDESGKYLGVNGENLILADAANAASFKVIPGTGGNSGKIQLKYGDKYVTFSSTDPTEGNTVNTFSMGSDGTASGTWLSFLDFGTLTDEDLITYSADRVSVSDVPNGQKVIVYTRIWNEDTKQYDIYAIDHRGELYPCYASGGKILWLGDGTGSLEWEFTEYLDAVTKNPNYYYELYNPYSEKYLVPQFTAGTVLSEEPLGINMPGRKNGEFYSDIIKWNDDLNVYISMKNDDVNKQMLVPCAQSVGMPIYFATLDELNLSGELHTVETVDNTEYGITIKMQDFSDRNSMSNFLGNDEYTKLNQKSGLLSNSLGSDNYPTTRSNGSLKNLYNNPKVVNHLFIKSVYESSGYFEFDSCQNFASFYDENGNMSETDFTVFRELGTTDADKKYTLQHGQFLPYNKITAGRYAVKNSENLYSALADPDNSGTGKLDENDPRKYEKLFLLADDKNKDTPNYYNGMELEASFVQTVSGLDAWGHDIIFEFTGDDDFWLYVDGELVIDLGGIHSALAGNVNFRTGEVKVNGQEKTLKGIFEENYRSRGLTEAQITEKIGELFDQNEKGQYIFKDYSTHSMRVFYMERGAGASNLHMRFNLASVTPGNVVVSKEISGEGAQYIDKDFVEYPFQIWYVEQNEDGTEGEEKLLGNDNENIYVSYQNSNQQVRFVQSYRPPGFTEEQAYKNIYFINPNKKAEIAFPDNTIKYKIVECAVDPAVYDSVTINGNTPSITTEGESHQLFSYSSELLSSEERPTINFDNSVKADVIRDLLITKKLVDEDENEVTDDDTTFDFRLYLSSYSMEENELPLADMTRYFVLSPKPYRFCKFENGRYVPTDLEYNRENVRKIEKGEIEGLSIDDVATNTSGFGAISKIPSGFTICVPGLPVGSMFKLTEDNKTGYGLKGYVCVTGDMVEDETHDVPSYLCEENSENIGTVIAGQTPQMEVVNKRGYGLNVEKNWTDLAITTDHDPIYVAVYVDGELLNGSVRQIASPALSTSYFWETLKPESGGAERKTLEGYAVKEVKLTGTLTVAADGTVSGYDTITQLENGGKINLNATRTAEATPVGEEQRKAFDYVVSYNTGADEGSTRTDVITNAREGGMAVRLFKWDSSDPLANGEFTITDENGTVIGKFTSDETGLVAMLYNIESDKKYTLEQTVAPRGYVGLDKKVIFVMNNDKSVSLYNEDGTTAWGSVDASDKKWAHYTPGQGGIDAYVDVFNKPFNFKLEKMDNEETGLMLDGAHFALHKQVGTSIMGYVKNKDPMTDFEDMTTDENGIVYICGGTSNRTINPGKNGSVYYLTEVRAPANYEKLDSDIIFRISPLGVPSLIEDKYEGQLVETDDSYVYTLSVPNEKVKDEVLLTITKTVKGNMGNKAKSFTFTFSTDDPDTTKEYSWTKNDEEQASALKSGDTFTMSHKDKVVITVSAGTKVTVSEANEGYTTTFKVDDNEAEAVSSREIEMSADTELAVTNELTGVIPTGVHTDLVTVTVTAVSLLSGLALLVRRRRILDDIEEDE